MNTRKTHQIVSNLQTLLRPDNDIHEPALLITHFCKKVETAIVVLPTVPTLRGVALEAISSALLYLSQSNDIQDSTLASSVESACELLSSFLSHSMFGWSDILFQWGVVNLARLSSIHDLVASSRDDAIRTMLSRPFVPHLVKFVEEGARYKFENGICDIFSHFVHVSNNERVNIGWLMAYTVLQNPSLFSNGSLLKNHAFHAPPTPSVVASISSCFDTLSKTHPLMVRHSILGLVQKTLDCEDEKQILIYLYVTIDILIHSGFILELVVKDILSVVTPEKILSIMCRLAEKNINENEKEQTDTVEEDKMEYELSTDLTQKSIMTSLCSLLLQLNGEVTVLVVNMLLECVAVISNEEHSKGEEEEDGEINALRVAHGQLLKIVKDLLDIVVSMSHKAITSLIFTSTPPTTVSPLQYTVSLQPGLSYWTDKLIELHDDQSHCLMSSLKELVENVGICSSELQSVAILNQLLSSCNQNKLSLVLSLYERFRLRHHGVCYSLISQGVTTILNSENPFEVKFEKWCVNLHHLINNSDISSQFQAPLLSSFNYLLKLLPLVTPTSALCMLDILESVSNGFVLESRLTDCLAAVKMILSHFIVLLVKISEAIMNDVSHCVWCMEQQLSKCRRILSLFSHGNPLIEIFICSDIINKITNERDVDTTDTILSIANTDVSLLTYNIQLGRKLQGMLLNTRQAQHGENLHRHRRTFDKDKVAISEIATTHCSDQIIWLISEIIGTSTNQIATSLMDAVAPNSTKPLKAWPELDFSSQPRHTLEFHLSIKRRMYEHPILWKILLLIATKRQGFLECSSLVYSLFYVLSLNWRRNRTAPAAMQSQDLQASVFLIQALGKAGWLSRPLCYVGELFEHITCEEVALLFDLCYNYIKVNYSVILEGRVVQGPLDDHRILRAILRKNIKKLGHLYCRFVSNKTTNS